MTFQIVLPGGEAREIPREGLAVGRGLECQVQFDDTKVSRRHALLWSDGERAFVRDEGSTNGTLVNGSPIQGGVVTGLHAADMIQIGAQAIRVEAIMSPVAAGPAVTLIDLSAVEAAPEVAPRSRTTLPLLIGAGTIILVVAVIAIALGRAGGKGGNQAGWTPSASTSVAAATTVPIAAASTLAPAETNAPVLTPTSTSSIPSATNAPDATVASATLNVRSGPGTDYEVLGKLSKGALLTVVGRFGNCDWLQVRSPVGDGWVAGTAGYVTVHVPCGDVPSGTFRPKSGLIKKPSGGAGELTVENTTANDAVLVLATSAGRPVASAYIRAGETLKIGAIPDGTADALFYSSGTEWDGKSFTQNAAYQKFDQTLEFKTTANNFMTYKVTLQAINGNTTATRVQPEDFPAAQ